MPTPTPTDAMCRPSMSRTARLFVNGLTLVLATACAGRAEERYLAITDVTVVDVDAGVVRRGQTVLVAGDTIAAVRREELQAPHRRVAAAAPAAKAALDSALPNRSTELCVPQFGRTFTRTVVATGRRLPPSSLNALTERPRARAR